MRPYTADCGALILPLASKVKLRAPSKNLYSNLDDMLIEIPRQARDDTEMIFQQSSLVRLGMTERSVQLRAKRVYENLAPAARRSGRRV